MALTHPTFVMPNLDISSFIRDMPGFAIIKDLHSNYLSANFNTVKEFGLKNPELLYGYSDLTIPHPLSESGQLYRNLDLEVITTGEPMKGICTFPFQGSIRPYHFRKSILKDMSGNSIATYSHAEVCNDLILIQFIESLIVNDPLKLNRIDIPNSFVLNREYPGIKLSALESNCLFYLIRRKSKYEISKLLNLSLKVTCFYIENIKNQLKANNIGDILDIAIIKGLINYVPPSIYNQLYSASNNFLSLKNLPTINPEEEVVDTNAKLNKQIKFTNRELDCAKLLIKGCRIKEIASIYNLSPRTVETHLNNLKIKLGCRDKVELTIKFKNMVNSKNLFL